MSARVAVVIGAGTIGLGWVRLFLEHGLTVRVVSTRSAPQLPPGAVLVPELEFKDGAALKRGMVADAETCKDD